MLPLDNMGPPGTGSWGNQVEMPGAVYNCSCPSLDPGHSSAMKWPRVGGDVLYALTTFGSLAPRSWEQESWSCPSLATVRGRVNPCTLTGQHSGTGGLNAGEPAPRFEQAGQLTLPPADGDISQSSAGELTLVV